MALNISSAAITLRWKEMFHAYQETNVFRPEMADYMTVALGESHKLDTIARRDAQFLDDASTLTEETDSTTSVTLNLFDPLKDWADLKHSDLQVRPDLALVRNKFIALGRNISNTETRALLGIICTAASGAGNERTFDDVTQVLLGDRVAAQLRLLASDLDVNGVPWQNRWGMLRSDLWYSLKDVAGVTSTDFGGMANVQFPMKILNYLNFQIVNVGTFWGTDFSDTLFTTWPTTARFNATNACGAFWHAESWAWRRVREMEQIGPRQFRPNDTHNIEARIHWGAIARDTEGMLILSGGGTPI